MVERWGGKILQEIKAPELKTPEKAPAIEPPVDMDRMLDLTDGNDDSLRELVEMYFNQTSKQIMQMQEAVRDSNAEALRRVAHSCAGASATLGMTYLVPKLRELEKLGAAGSLTGASEICDGCGQEYQRIAEFLKQQPALHELVNKLTQA
jgi:HPt (histidine-containing phosphotransfer) domain-containing protein